MLDPITLEEMAGILLEFKRVLKDDGLVKSLNPRHPGDGRDPELSDITGFRPSPE
jgi:hypothetical protein